MTTPERLDVIDDKANSGRDAINTSVQRNDRLRSTNEQREPWRLLHFAHASQQQRSEALSADAVERDLQIAELQDRDRRKDEFLAMLSHELRNPLAPVRAVIELMQMSDEQPAMVKRSLAAAGRQIAHMTRMLDDLLDVSRITSGKFEIRRAPVSLASVVEQALQTTEKVVNDRQHTLTISLPAAPVVLDADATRLVQVFSNLLHNAAKYTDKGGNIELSATLAGDRVMVRVVDDGVGIRPELLPQVFDLFVQADRAADRQQGGLGLGLTLVHRLVAMHGGTVIADSRGTGSGSEFTVVLPVVAVEAVQPAGVVVHRRIQLRELQPLHILLIEDDDDIREPMKDLLELCGHRVDDASDGTLGFDLLAATNPHVALIDIGLPGLDGYEVAACARSRGVEMRTRLVAMTGYGRAEDRERALAAGFDAHIVKPVAIDELAGLLQRLCPPNETCATPGTDAVRSPTSAG